MYRIKQQIFLMLVATLLALSAACQAEDANWRKVSRSVYQFHEQFNADRFQDIYAASDPRFRASISESDFIQKLRDLRQQYGHILKSHLNGFEETTWRMRHFPSSIPVRFIGFSNECDNGRFQEQFKWDVRGEEPKLLEYKTELKDWSVK